MRILCGERLDLNEIFQKALTIQSIFNCITLLMVILYQPKNYSKQFEKIRKLLLKGTAKVLKWKLTDLERGKVEYNAKLILNTSDGEVFNQAIIH